MGDFSKYTKYVYWQFLCFNMSSNYLQISGSEESPRWLVNFNLRLLNLTSHEFNFTLCKLELTEIIFFTQIDLNMEN